MNLPDYIKQVGVAEFAKRFGVEERTAISWIYRARRPRPEIAVRIIAETDVTWEGIYPEKPKKKRGRGGAAAASA